MVHAVLELIFLVRPLTGPSTFFDDTRLLLHYNLTALEPVQQQHHLLWLAQPFGHALVVQLAALAILFLTTCATRPFEGTVLQ